MDPTQAAYVRVKTAAPPARNFVSIISCKPGSIAARIAPVLIASSAKNARKLQACSISHCSINRPIRSIALFDPVRHSIDRPVQLAEPFD